MKLIYILLTFICVTGQQSYAGGGGGYDHDNGGDMCENRFMSVRDDLKIWITQGGSADLRLPTEITLEKYNGMMLKKIQNAKVSCIDQQIMVRGAEKTCRNFVAIDGSFQIQCNRTQFMTTSESDQYILVHHEYAGLAGFEINTSEASNYEISNQISGYLESSIVKKLAVKKSEKKSDDPFNPASCLGPQMSVQDARNLTKPGSENTTFASFKIYTRLRRCNQLNECEKWKQIDNNEVKLYDRSRNGTFVLIPNYGQINLTSTDDSVSVYFLTLPGGVGVARGLFITCGKLQRFDGTCSVGTMTRNTGLESIGEAFGIIGAHCARLVHTQKRFIDSSSEWIEQELVLMSKY